MSADSSFRKALYLIDRDETDRAEQLLRQVLADCESENEILYYRACCCLGELLVESDKRDEAVFVLRRVSELAGNALYEDVLNYEISLAKRLLNA